MSVVAATRKPRALAPDLKRFKEIKDRVSDLYNYNAHVIRKNKTLPVWAGIFLEMRWLCQEVSRLGETDKLTTADAERLKKTVKFVDRVCDEQGDAIASGQFVKVAAGVFGAFRFLVRTLQARIVDLVDEDTALGLMEEALPEEHVDRIQLDLSEGITDDEPTA